MRSVLAIVYLFVTVAWLVALVAAPYAATHHGPDTATFRAVGAVSALGSVVCHQLARRSFHLWGVQLPVCARCTGLYTGAAFGALLTFVGGLSRPTPKPHWGGYSAARTAVVMSALPTLCLIAADLIGAAEPSGLARAGAALPLGATVPWVVGLTLQGRL